MSRTTRLGLLSTTVDLEIEDGVDVDEVDRALAFLATHVSVVDVPDGPADVRVTVTASGLEPPAGTPVEELYVRRSASDFFTIPAERATVDGLEHLHCTRTGSRFVFDAAHRTVRAVVPAGGAMDLVELLRDVVLRLEENAGTLVLHATAATGPDGAVLVAGAKAAGKSTVLLELVEHHGYQVLSGDKALVRVVDGVALVHGWPDYPHLGYGTVVKYPGLADIAGLAADHEAPVGHEFSALGKFAVDPGRFRDRFPCAPVGVQVPVRAVLHPAIGPGATELTPVAGHDDRRGLLAGVVESVFDGSNAGWHGLVEDRRSDVTDVHDAVLDLLADAPAWTLRGEGDLRDALPAELRVEAAAAC